MSLLLSFLLGATALVSFAGAQVDADLTGTWTTKSRKVFTGPGFYDPINDKFIEPSVTGISYSFTDDGHFEQAYYRAISNRMLLHSISTRQGNPDSLRSYHAIMSERHLAIPAWDI
jgi:hypothetical protein